MSLEKDMDNLIPESSTKKKAMKPRWGYVQPDGTVLLDHDTQSLPASTPSLVRLAPHQRVAVDHYGTTPRVTGVVSPPEIDHVLNERSHLDNYLVPGTFYADGNAVTSTSRGWPAPLSGRLTVEYVGGHIVQNYMTWPYINSGSRMFTRVRYAGNWRAWDEIALFRETGTPMTVGEWRIPFLLNGWRPFGQGFGEPRYRLEGRSVRLAGVVNGHSQSDPVFNLPSGFWPSYSQLLPLTAWTSQSGPYRLNVNRSGVVTHGGFSSSVAPSWISYDGVTFPLD